VGADLDWLIASINSADPQTYERLRPGDRLGRVFRMQLRPLMVSDLPRSVATRVVAVLQHENRSGITELVALSSPGTAPHRQPLPRATPSMRTPPSASGRSRRRIEGHPMPPRTPARD
jgi:hypothetical protein